MFTQNFDFVFQLRESFLDKIGKASFYGDLYPAYFDYTDAAFRNAGGGARYIFLAPPTISSEANKGFLKVSMPFRLSRPDDVEAMIEGIFSAEVRIVKSPAIGVPESIRLDFGDIQLAQVNSQQLQEVADNLRQVDTASLAMLIFMLGSGAIDDNGTLNFEGLVKDKLIEFVGDEVGEIEVAPALAELGKFDLSLSAADYKVIKGSALALMLDFQGSPLNGNIENLETYITGTQDFAIAMTERLAQSILDEQVRNGNLPTRIDGVNDHPVFLENLKIQFNQGFAKLSGKLKTKRTLNYIFFKDTHVISADVAVEFSLHLNQEGGPIITIQKIDLKNFDMSGAIGWAFGSCFESSINEGLGDAPINTFIQNFLSDLGILKLNWQIPGGVPYKLQAIANEIKIASSEIMLLGNARLLNLDNSIFQIPANFSYPPPPIAFVGMEGTVQKLRRLIADTADSYIRPDRTFSILIPCPGSGDEIPAIYNSLPELKLLVVSGKCGLFTFFVHYQKAWTRRKKIFSNSYQLDYDAFLQFMAPGRLDLTWYLKNTNDSRKPIASDSIGTGDSIKYTFTPTSTRPTDIRFCKKLILQVDDIFGRTRFGSTEFCGEFKDIEITENPSSLELGVFQRELLLERIQEASDRLSMQNANGKLATAAISTFSENTIKIEGELEQIGDPFELIFNAQA